MLRAVALLVCFSTAVVAAPVPRPSEQELLAKLWGKTEGRGEFEMTGKKLTIRTNVQPDTGLIALLGGQTSNAPRAERTVTGDFVMTVKVSDAARPNKDAKHADSWPNSRAGLFISGGGYGVELHLYQYFSKLNGVVKEEPTRCVWVDTWFPRGGAGSSLKMAAEGKSTYLRITRKDKVVTVAYSFDGTEWSAPFNPRQTLEFPDEVTVGVFFGHSTYQTLDATFEGLTIEKPKEK
jgi:regulation of enolase protein 1 (concanavalin A-like superfamily)